MSRIVIALGGNALQRQGGASAAAQQAEAAVTARQLVPLIKQGHQIVIVHGNGPQIGDILLHEEAFNTDEVPTMPLDSCDAMSQGMIGYWLQQAIDNEMRADGIRLQVATVVTQVVVHADDPAFNDPSKPVGPFYKDEAEARAAAEKRHFVVKPDSNRGWRRVVPSPHPQSIIEKPTIEQLLNNNCLVIAAGGGGVPVIDDGQKLTGIEAVIDKDMSAAALADSINAETLLILTSVDGVRLHFGTSEETELHEASIEDLHGYIDQNEFAPGSMLPKVQAAINFVEKAQGQRRAIIASLDNAEAAINGQGGTVIK